MAHHLVQQLAGPGAVDGGNREQFLAYAEAVKLVRVVKPLVVVDLVDHDVGGFLHFSQQLGETLIQIGDSQLHVAHEQNHVRLVHGQQHLLVDFLLENVGTV